MRFCHVQSISSVAHLRFLRGSSLGVSVTNNRNIPTIVNWRSGFIDRLRRHPDLQVSDLLSDHVHKLTQALDMIGRRSCHASNSELACSHSKTSTRNILGANFYKYWSIPTLAVIASCPSSWICCILPFVSTRDKPSRVLFAETLRQLR